jgi:hypothetical protein
VAFIYLDDSKHPHCGFTLGTFVAFQEDPAPTIARALLAHGLTPYVDEFKSSHRMVNAPALQALRDCLRGMLSASRVGLAIAASEGRLTNCCTALLQKMLKHKDLAGEHQVFTDEGIYHWRQDQQRAMRVEAAERCKFHFEQNSRECLGIQIADLVAFTCGLMMKDALGLLPKIIRSGENSGYDPDSPMELGFSMWASLRYNFLCVPRVGIDFQTDDPITLRTVVLEQYGLVVDDQLPEQVQTAAHERFGSMYLGCIH